ncbi:MAG TPA: amino acid ABC transporter permease, partial [Gammaproteobacteria bacterium]|nr:amino acid ABC transporter permease [Gammaproteobacteria bacterium]
MYDWNFNVIWDYRMVYMRGALITLELSLLAVVFSMSLGLFVGIARHSKRYILSFPASCYVEIFRDTPLLIQIVWIYYCLPILLGVTLTAFWASTVALSLHMSAYVAEIFRAGIV